MQMETKLRQLPAGAGYICIIVLPICSCWAHILIELCEPTCHDKVTSLRWVPTRHIVPLQSETYGTSFSWAYAYKVNSE